MADASRRFRGVASQATLVVTFLEPDDGGPPHVQLASFGSPDFANKTAEEFTDHLAKIAIELTEKANELFLADQAAKSGRL